jgi:hypothetical protein
LTPIQPKIPHHKMMNPHLKTLAAGTLALAAFAVNANAQVAIGTTTGSNYTTATWITGATSSQGNWFLAAQGDSLNNISDSTQNGRASIGSESFFILGGTASEYIDAYLPLGGSLATGQSVGLYANYSWNGGIRGIEFGEAFGAGGLFRFEHGGGTNALNLVVGSNPAIEILGDVFNQAISYNISYSTPTSVDISASILGNSTPFYTANIAVAVMPNEIKFYTGGYAGGTDQTNYGMYFNNITTVPEPSTYALLGLGAASILWRIRRRKTS